MCTCAAKMAKSQFNLQTAGLEFKF